MTRILSAILLGISLFAASGEARADWDDQPGFGFTGDYLVTTPDAPCGTGTPPRGHFPPDIPTVGPFQIVTLSVRQDPHRLCYVFGQIAEAPTIRVRQGEDMFIKLRNEITDPAALDKLVVPGHLDDPNPEIATQAGNYPVLPAMHHKATGTTNLHLHGLAVSPMAPQDETLKTCVDPAVGPATCGRREFVYHYRIAQTMPAGLYWYHPHVHGEVQAQMLMGLSGALIVEGPTDDARRAAGIEDRVFVVRQSQDLDAPAPAAASDAAGPGSEQPAAKPHGKKRHGAGEQVDTADEMACSSNTGTDELTLNGAVVLDGDAKDADLAHLEIGAGRKQLWRVLNAATDSFLDLALIDETGKPLPIAIAARDSVPLSNDAGNLLPAESTIEAQLVPPAGRLEFYVDAPAIGHKAYLVSHAVDTGCAGDKVPARRLAYLTPVEPAQPATAAVTTELPATPVAAGPVPGPFNGILARKTDRQRVLAFAEYPHPGSDDLNDFYIFERKPGAVLRPFEMGAEPAITVNAGTTEEWVIENWTNELHAFHIHQVHFRVLEVDDKVQKTPALLDVMTVPTARTKSGDVTKAAGPVVPGKIRIKLYFPPELAGDIPFHCHLVDHEDSGMMGVIRVQPPQTALQQKAELSLQDILKNPPICRSPDDGSGAAVNGLRPAPDGAVMGGARDGGAGAVGRCPRPNRAFLGREHEGNERKTWAVIALCAAMMVLELAGGSLFGSLALIADGLHMATHAAALLIAAVAYTYARQHANDPSFAFGTGKLGDLAGFSSAIVLAMVALLIGYEAISRLLQPIMIDFDVAIPTAVLGLGVNLASAWLLGDGDRGAVEQGLAHRDHNMRAAFMHVVADVAVSVLAIFGLLAGKFLGWAFMDPAMGIVGMLVIASWSYGLVRASGAVLLDMTPGREMTARIRAEIEVDGDRLHDLRVWRLGPGHVAAIVAVTTDRPREPDFYRARLGKFDLLSHVTIEIRSAAP